MLLVRIQSFTSVPHGTIQKSAIRVSYNWLCCDCTPCESQQWHGNSSYPIMPLTECGSVWKSTCFGSKGSGVQISPLRGRGIFPRKTRWVQFSRKPFYDCGCAAKIRYRLARYENGKTNPPPVGTQKTSRVRNLKTQRSGNAEVGRTFGDTVHIGT